ncbi:MAG: hypothetical protein RQ739_00210 [Desulfotignum sp.]|nr:hypothetical protein [Desulfotignum sp.]
MTKPLHDHPIHGSFVGIKKTLDPGLSYLIFENDLTLGEESIFDPTHMAYAYFEASAFTWKKVVDETLQREYLVVCIGTGKEDEVLGQVMGYGFPRETVYYLYKAKEA